uniref:Serine threonine protein kinase n=1 Tax=Tetraselmis sp. GSL018 TaxID=582737 RepID=A0A061RTT4_9CHLO
MKPVLSPWLPDRLRRSNWRHTDFSPLEKMFQGEFSSVFKVRDAVSQELLCLKVYSKDRMSSSAVSQVYREVEIHSRLRHLHIIQFFAAWEDDWNIFLLMELAHSGDLLREVHSRGGVLNEKSAVVEIVQPLLSVISYLHSQGVLHRDIKPENILFTQIGKHRLLKLADFGMSIDATEWVPTARTGTVDYMAPELVSCSQLNQPEPHVSSGVSPRYGPVVDTWSLGILVHELLIGAPPFENDSIHATVRDILHAPVDVGTSVSEEAASFIYMALEKNPLFRADSSTLIRHPWIQVHGLCQSVRYQPGEMDRMRSDSLRAQPPSSCSCLSQKHMLAGKSLGAPPRSMPRVHRGMCCDGSGTSEGDMDESCAEDTPYERLLSRLGQSSGQPSSSSTDDAELGVTNLLMDHMGLEAMVTMEGNVPKKDCTGRGEILREPHGSSCGLGKVTAPGEGSGTWCGGPSPASHGAEQCTTNKHGGYLTLEALVKSRGVP